MNTPTNTSDSLAEIRAELATHVPTIARLLPDVIEHRIAVSTSWHKPVSIDGWLLTPKGNGPFLVAHGSTIADAVLEMQRHIQRHRDAALKEKSDPTR